MRCLWGFCDPQAPEQAAIRERAQRGAVQVRQTATIYTMEKAA